MPNAYSQIYIHIIFAVKGRKCHISEQHRDELEKYISGIINKFKCKCLSIYCNPDHIHMLVSFSPCVSISDLVRIIKSNSSKFINEKRWMPFGFFWQEGYGAFSYAESQINAVKGYISSQPEHHKKKSFKEEYISILKNFNIDFDKKYLFLWEEK